MLCSTVLVHSQGDPTTLLCPTGHWPLMPKSVPLLAFQKQTFTLVESISGCLLILTRELALTVPAPASNAANTSISPSPLKLIACLLEERPPFLRLLPIARFSFAGRPPDG